MSCSSNNHNKRSSKGIFLFLLFLVFVMEVPQKIGGAPFLLGNQMTSLSVIPRTEEQATALLEFLRNNPQFLENNSTTTQTEQIPVNSEQVILVPRENVSRLSNGLEDIGFQLDDSTNIYQIS